MSLKYKTKPLTLVRSIEEIWDTLAVMEETIKLLEKIVDQQDVRIKKLEFLVMEETETKRLY
jgi:hypothetical protein